MYISYETATGQISGFSTSEPTKFPGYDWLVSFTELDALMQYVAAGTVAKRVDIDWSSIPADALVSINNAPAKAMTALPTAPGVWTLKAVGKYKGQKVVTVLTAAEAESKYTAAIDAKRNELQMQYLTRGTSLSLEYINIQREYADYSTVVPVVLAGLALADRQKRWPTAMTEVALSGKTLAQVMAGYGVAIASNERKNSIIGRIAVVAKTKVRAATTVEAKTQAYNTINWNWTPGF